MRKLLPFFVCLMLVLTSWSGMAHAAEAVGGSMGGIEFTVHMSGDGDEAPADSDKAVPHHHSICHGHDIGTPAHLQGAPLHARVTNQRPVCGADVLVAADGSVSPRPPRA
ncbi:hypothetical protein ACBY01_16385 [Sphingomonas sp. ac-8]|uniref:hypothetical protein n=1 Tax=Sphingomonas sp. ac-8 TaxID=3242977 RepID=UPI003A7FF2F3